MPLHVQSIGLIISAIVQSLAKRVRHDFFMFMSSRAEKVTKPIIFPSSKDRSSEVIRFVGFALSKTLKKYRKTEKNISKGFDPDDIAGAIEVLESIRLLHGESIQNSTYLHMFYNKVQCLRNRGGLTLIHPDFMSFATMLIEKAECNTSENAVQQKASRAYCDGLSALFLDLDLKASFSASCSKLRISMKNIVQDEILRELITRTYNCMMNTRITIMNDVHKNRATQTKLRTGLGQKLNNNGAVKKRRKTKAGSLPRSIVKNIAIAQSAHS